MLDVQKIEKLRELAQEICVREGCRLYDIEFVSDSHSGGRVLRVYVDKANSENSKTVSVNDCANISNGLGLLLDVEDVVPGETYSLEVSSPGLERSLKQVWHFQSAVGSRVLIKTKEPIATFNPGIPGLERRTQVKGVLSSADEEHLIVEMDKVQFTIPMVIIAKAHTVFDFDISKGKKVILNKKKRS